MHPYLLNMVMCIYSVQSVTCRDEEIWKLWAEWAKSYVKLLIAEFHSLGVCKYKRRVTECRLTYNTVTLKSLKTDQRLVFITGTVPRDLTPKHHRLHFLFESCNKQPFSYTVVAD